MLQLACGIEQEIGMEREREDEYLTIKQAAKYLSIPEPVLRLTIRCGKIPARRRGGSRGTLVRRGDLRPFLDPLSESPAGEAADE
jgi:excisionase family DNA binding protein